MFFQTFLDPELFLVSLEYLSTFTYVLGGINGLNPVLKSLKLTLDLLLKLKSKTKNTFLYSHRTGKPMLTT